ncbi:hypothetical protein CC85DRAFT_166525 [Cutaneotrichosporon oleaginosum]|uniref:Uncharacterized protein n=1 Tax=Cutaneotrichosporon oleaginosum TaxID=879819 RepID=A0A0J0XFZ7_9TREE|nr:uncharacterized protein CC85DRAFT_166525 [Cutaneotrichosporon oleaginosum]KLT39985.1 hypothetical protein CC85DRAFT_166525 [Cutaneotrichosporon oleaginosum]TXT14174.1 hypothetical protein COLE_00367 [Cutaneotrichosporon oleaginosum]
MPGLLSAIPGLSNIPNPLNIFNNDDAQHAQHQSQSPSSSPTTTTRPSLPTSASSNSMAANAQASTPNEGGASKFVSMLTKGLDVFTLNSNPSTPQKAVANVNAEAEDPSPTPMQPTASRTDPGVTGSSASSPSRLGGKAGVVIADSAAEGDGPRSNLDGNRRRGLSSASRGSGGVVAPSSRRNRRVETYVLVKPPPTSSKNPLNLQLQLVMPAKPGRPRGGSDAASRAMVPPTPTSTTAASTAPIIDDSSVPSTPARQSFESPVEKVASGGSDATSSTPSGSVTSDAPLSEAASGATTLPTLPEDQAATKLRRRSSTGSQTSTSNASMISSASGKQRIVPLYNLAVHNVVQPTIVTDAGTDHKVAKFLKRNLDINGVGILEPSEVWLPLHTGGGSVAGNSPRPSIDPNGNAKLPRPASMISNMSLLSPAVTRDDAKRSSVDAGGKPGKPGKLDAHGLRVQEEGPKKFFGKIFRKRQNTETPEQPRRGSVSTSRTSTVVSMDAAGSLKVPATPPTAPAVHFNGAAELAQVGHPTFGLSPAMMARNSSVANLDQNGAIVGLIGEVPKSEGLESDMMNIVRSGRPVGYTWTVRRWAKKNTEGWASHIVAAAAAGLDMVANAIPGDGSDEVVFEWVKMRFSATNESAIAALKRHPAASEGADLLKRARPLPTPSPGPSPAGSRVSLVSGQRSYLDAPGTVKGRKAPPSPASKRRGSPPAARSSDEASADVCILDADEHAVPAVHEPDQPPTPEDDGYDSDPEDSETPWACSVWVKRTGQRQLLATLTPAPHHPKVIAVLRIPSVLKGLSLTDIPAPVGKSAAHTDIAARVRDEVCLSEENLKDVVSVTAMWLVAREEFSGFGRKEKRRA